MAWPTLMDVASRTDTTGKIKRVSEMLSQCRQLTPYIPYIMATEMTGHEGVYRTSMPGGHWRMPNSGVPYSKSTTEKFRVGLGELTDYSQIDKKFVQISGEGFRRSEDVAFLQGMGQTVEQTFIYGNSVTNPASFTGIMNYYNSISGKASGQNIVNAGGTGSSNASILLIGFGTNTIFGLYPRGSKAGLVMEDKGDTVPAYDSFGHRFEAYTTYFSQNVGLCIQDWRYCARMANIDTTNASLTPTGGSAGLFGPSAPDLFANLSRMALMLPTLTQEASGITSSDAEDDPSPGIRPVIVCNRTVAYGLKLQAMRNRNVFQTITDAAGRVVESFLGIPIIVSDQMLNTEAAVT